LIIGCSFFTNHSTIDFPTRAAATLAVAVVPARITCSLGGIGTAPINGTLISGTPRLLCGGPTIRVSCCVETTGIGGINGFVSGSALGLSWTSSSFFGSC
jgi:hypothetical protein